MGKKIKGFTLLEILVVVAIIGFITVVVVASLSTARNKGSDAGVKSNLKSVSSQAEIFYHTNTSAIGTFTNVCANSGSYGANTVSVPMLAAAKAIGLSSYTINGTGTGITATCNENSSSWAAEVPLYGSTISSPKMWCVDSLSKSKQTNASIGSSTICP